LSTRQRDFFIANIIAVGLTILFTLVLFSFLISIFEFNQENFFPITFVLLFFGVSVYYFVTRKLFLNLFKNEKEIDGLIKETLHELNTPVATIEMNVKMLKKNFESDEKGLKRLTRIEKSCENLLDLYNQMEYSLKEQIETIHSEKFDFKEVVDKSCKKFELVAKEIQIINEVKSFMINCDKSGMQKVIDNLISNALKYNNSKGKVILSLQNNIFSIQDTGIGIDTKHLFHIFDKYYQENSSYKGIGLGLNIVKKYCDKYKIDIKIDSKKDEGSTFYLDFKGIVWQSNK
jgi:two-component system, OmpR family, sensor kinase